MLLPVNGDSTRLYYPFHGAEEESDAAFEKRVSSVCREIGERGMLISSMGDLNEGDRVVVTFHIPEVLFALARGQVRYEIDANSSDNKVNKYGIEFVDVDFNTRRLIRYYVASKTNLFKETEAD